jgi:hypothetical protein
MLVEDYYVIQCDSEERLRAGAWDNRKWKACGSNGRPQRC